MIVFENQNPIGSLFSFFLFQPHPFSFAFYLAYDLGLTFGTEIILVSSTDKAEETAGHYDKNYGRGISLYKHLFPLLSLKVLQYLTDWWQGGSEVSYSGIFKKGKKK